MTRASRSLPTPSTTAIRRERAASIDHYQRERGVVSRCCCSPIIGGDRQTGAFRCSLCDRPVDPTTGKDLS